MARLPAVNAKLSDFAYIKALEDLEDLS
ncbi:hypothetical protein VTN00DRAFT_2751 [Thermoascus crustaceus]